MKKVLIITHLQRASPRVPGLAKYLSRFGWEPIVMSPIVDSSSIHSPSTDLSSLEFRTIITPFDPTLDSRVIKKLNLNPDSGIEGYVAQHLGKKIERNSIASLLNLLRSIMWYPDRDKGWIGYADEAVRLLLKNEKIDAIISSSSPETSHIIASHIKSGYDLPWIADFRDLWSDNHNYPYGKIRKNLDRHLERKTISIADAITTVSPIWAEKLRYNYPGKNVVTVTNGFDPETISCQLESKNHKFFITYTGQIYTPRQNPAIILQAVHELIYEGILSENSFECRFFGPTDYNLSDMIEKMELDNYVKQYGPVDRTVSIKKQRESDLLLLLNWEDPNEKGVYPLKIFEYLAARRPILATGGYGGDVVDLLLKDTHAGITANRLPEVKNAVKFYYSEFVKSGTVPYSGNPEKIHEFSYLKMAEKFSKVLNDISS